MTNWKYEVKIPSLKKTPVLHTGIIENEDDADVVDTGIDLVNKFYDELGEEFSRATMIKIEKVIDG